MNREQWLTELAQSVEEFFKGFHLRPYRLTCGWPCRNALSSRARRIGECHSLTNSKGGTHEIFISPLIDNSLEAAGIACHELAHVAAGVEAGHKGRFIRVCKHIGLTKGKPTTAMPDARLDERLAKIIDKLGEYPHQALVPQIKEAKPSTTVRLKCECGCSVSIALKWLTQAGAPRCGCGGIMSRPEEEGA